MLVKLEESLKTYSKGWHANRARFQYAKKDKKAMTHPVVILVVTVISFFDNDPDNTKD